MKDVKPKSEAEPSPPKTEGLKSALSIFRGKRHPKKSVKWRRDDELEAIQYFEVDASERSEFFFLHILCVVIVVPSLCFIEMKTYLSSRTVGMAFCFSFLKFELIFS